MERAGNAFLSPEDRGLAERQESDQEGLTAAGLLMFGKHTTIQEAFPLYMLDYQERPATQTEPRWLDRLTLDGTWSGNLYDFTAKFSSS